MLCIPGAADYRLEIFLNVGTHIFRFFFFLKLVNENEVDFIDAWTNIFYTFRMAKKI